MSPVTSALKLLPFLPVAQQESGTRKAIFWSVTVYNKNVSSPCNLTAQIEPVQNNIIYTISGDACWIFILMLYLMLFQYLKEMNQHIIFLQSQRENEMTGSRLYIYLATNVSRCSFSLYENKYRPRLDVTQYPSHHPRKRGWHLRPSRVRFYKINFVLTNYKIIGNVLWFKVLGTKGEGFIFYSIFFLNQYACGHLYLAVTFFLSCCRKFLMNWTSFKRSPVL